MIQKTYAENHYKSAHKRFLKKIIEHFFETELPKNFGPSLRSVIADKLIEIFNSNFMETQHLKPGQILWNAVHKDTRADSINVKLVPVILTIINDQDVSEIEKGQDFRTHHKNVIARITKEAYQQDALLSMRDIALLLAKNDASISHERIEYEKEKNVSLPHTGSLQDMGTCLTHKYQIVFKYVVEKKDPTIIASETNHTIAAVDHYLKDYNRVKTLYLDNKDTIYIRLVTNMSINLINQYINIIEQYVKEKTNN